MQTRRERVLIEMGQVVPWKGLIALIESYYSKGEGGRPAYPLLAMLRGHLMQNWFGYSDPAMEEALYETTILRQFSGLHLDRIPDEATILYFRACWKFPLIGTPSASISMASASIPTAPADASVAFGCSQIVSFCIHKTF